MKTYTVQAQRVGPWWMLTSADVPGAVSQVRHLSQAEPAIREAIAFVEAVAEDSFAVTVEPVLGGEHQRSLEQARQATMDAERATLKAAERSREIVRLLAESEGLTGSDIAAVLQVSKQRVSQLLAKPVTGGEVKVRKAQPARKAPRRPRARV